MDVDCVVVGAGFGGLGAAMTLAEGGARVALCEALKYPGGCASTFTRQGWRFESGATLFSGFDPGQLFDRWITAHSLAVETRVLDPMVELRAGDLRLAVPPSREGLIARLCALALQLYFLARVGLIDARDMIAMAAVMAAAN